MSVRTVKRKGYVGARPHKADLVAGQRGNRIHLPHQLGEPIQSQVAFFIHTRIIHECDARAGMVVTNKPMAANTTTPRPLATITSIKAMAA